MRAEEETPVRGGLDRGSDVTATKQHVTGSLTSDAMWSWDVHSTYMARLSENMSAPYVHWWLRELEAKQRAERGLDPWPR